MPPLLAVDAVEAGQIGAVVVLAGMGGAAAKWFGEQLWAWWREKRGLADATQKTITDHLQAAVNRLQENEGACNDRVERLQGRVERAEIKSASLIGHLRYLETILRNAKVDFAPWIDPSTDSALHHPVTEPK